MKCHASPLHEVREEAHTICVRVCAHQSKWPSSWPALGADHRLISSWIQCTESHENPACCSTGTCQCMHLPSKPAFWPSTDVFSCLNSVHTEVLCTNALPAAAQDPASAYVLSLKSPLSGPDGYHQLRSMQMSGDTFGLEQSQSISGMLHRCTGSSADLGKSMCCARTYRHERAPLSCQTAGV
eukprot:scaffold27419_cov25-Tisochrysis_lutea.AAC.2